MHLQVMLTESDLLARVKELGDGSGSGSGSGRGKAGRKLGYSTKVQFNGNLMVGTAYTAMLGLLPGDAFEIKLGRQQIQLIPLGAAEEE